ncbi:MAG: DUF4430 domain-containing protein [Christensenellaceae bacterium]
MKKRFIIFFMVLTMIAVMMGGCKIQTPDEAAVQASQKSTAVQTVQPTVAAVSSPSASPSQAAVASDDSYDVSDIQNQGKEISDAEYQKYLNEANIRKADENAPKDQYGTNPVPDKMPAPVEWQDAVIDKNAVKTCTLYIECSTILNHMDQFDRDKMDVLPSDGIIYSAKEVAFYEGESVFDVLLREMQKNRIHMEYSMTPGYNSNYIEGIGNIYQYDCGELSGWMYSVNGWFANYGCSRYPLVQGDVVELHYTCDLGRDLGTNWIK